MNMDKHVQACNFDNKSNGIHIIDIHEDVVGISNPASWKVGQKCSFGCQGQWHNPESFDAHKRDHCHDHLEYLNKQVVRLEKSIESRMIKENVSMVGLQQQPSSGPMHNANGAAVNTVLLSAGASKSNNNHNNSASLELEVHRLSTQMQTLESQQQLIVRSDSTPLLNASLSSFPPTTVAVASKEDVSGMVMKKLELCLRKADKYEEMAMVLNVSLDRLLTQINEIDNQRRKESESREAQERKIQVGVVIDLK